ncbi:MAG: carboxypeptidase regulatory-like domain-containing protein, partial [Acidobacteriia bacterium]|nr:carboxypeptidase regulatory-like domain-containing protein [Terriglobia bacterium]
SRNRTGLLVCASVFCAIGAPQGLGTGVIAGVVADRESGSPARKAIVTLTLEGTPRRWATARTDSSGRFTFEDLPAGKYNLRATKAGEGTAVYGANSVRGLGDLLRLGEGEKRGGITLRLIRLASVSGHVYDSDGAPLPGVAVTLLGQTRNLGEPVLVNYRQIVSDDRGEYRMGNVDPGRYYVRAAPQPLWRFAGAAIPVHEILVEQYYGGARDRKDAATVVIHDGESLSNIDIRLASEPAVDIQGQIAGVPEPIPPPQGQQAAAPSVGLVVAGSFGPGIQVQINPLDGGPQGASSVAAMPPDYRFQYSALPAGRYRISAQHQWGKKAYGASQVFDLRPGSNDIQITLEPAIEIQGTLRTEGHAPPAESPTATTRQNIPGNGFRVQLTRPGQAVPQYQALPQYNVSAPVGADGRFTLSQVLPGEWALAVTPIPPGFLKSAQFGDRDVRFTPFEVGPANGDTPLNIVLSMNTARIEGEVQAEASDSKRAGIVLAPVGPYHNLARFYYGAAADDEGKFKVEGIAPGQYKIFALEKMTPAAFRNPEAVDRLGELGETGEAVELAEGATLHALPKLIPANRAAKALE